MPLHGPEVVLDESTCLTLQRLQQRTIDLQRIERAKALARDAGFTVPDTASVDLCEDCAFVEVRIRVAT
jgi:hypothetical protein